MEAPRTLVMDVTDAAPAASREAKDGEGEAEATPAAPEEATEPPTLDLALFPAYFQAGAAAKQLHRLYEALIDAPTPPTIPELTRSLEFDAKRVMLLLDVMQSRKLIHARDGPTRTWAVGQSQ